MQEQPTLVEGSYQERVWETLALACFLETRNYVMVNPTLTICGDGSDTTTYINQVCIHSQISAEYSN